MNEKTGGQGGAPIDLRERGHGRQNARMLAKAIREGWLAPIMVDADDTKVMMRDCAILRTEVMVSDESPSVKARSFAALAQIPLAALAHNRALAEMVDKSDRLDAGEATENITHRASQIIIEDPSTLNDNPSTLKDRYDEAPQEHAPCDESSPSSPSC